VLKRSIVAGLLTTAALAGISMDQANAVVAGPGVGAAIAGIPETTTPVRWVCGPYRCRWRAGWRGPVRPWAVWGPPRFPGCYYEKRRGAWIEVCVYPWVVGSLALDPFSRR
jgi:hypothetical protein